VAPLKTKSSSALSVAILLFVSFADLTRAEERLDTAEQCITKFIENIERVRERYAVYAHGEIIETSEESPETARLQWFVDEVNANSKSTRRYAESKWKYEKGDILGKEALDKILLVGEQVYFSAHRSRPLKLVRIPGNDEEVRKRKSMFISRLKVPNLFALTMFHNSVIKFPIKDDDVAEAFFGSMRLAISKKTELGIQGIWVSKPKHGIPRMVEVNFSKNDSYMPTIVRGSFLEESPNLESEFDVSNLESIPWYEIRTSWTRLDIDDKRFVPSEITNTTFRVSKLARDGREVQVVAFWSMPPAEAAELDPEKINSEALEPGELSKIRNELVERFVNR